MSRVAKITTVQDMRSADTDACDCLDCRGETSCEADDPCLECLGCVERRAAADDRTFDERVGMGCL